MAGGATHTGLISFAGREFRYSYSLPFDSDIQAEVAAMKASGQHSWKTDEQLRIEAASKLELKIKTDTANKILGFLAEAYKERSSLKYPGISQKISESMWIDQIASKYGLVQQDWKKESFERAADVMKPREDAVLDPDGARSYKDGDYIRETELRKIPGMLVDQINLELHKKFLDSDDGVIVDAEISRPSVDDSFGEQIDNIALQISGGGRTDASIAQEMYNLNRFGRTFVGPNRELTGFTFITRPHCNLSTSNLASASHFAPLVHAGPKSLPYAIRCWLDTSFASEVHGSDGKACPFVDYKNPFLVPLCNRLSNLSGWPDFSVATETSEGGFYSENQTVAIGGDQLARGYDFTLNFDEMTNGLIMSIFDYWSQYISMIGDGRLHQYMSDIEHHLMGYTVSIYRFITDHTGRNITRWAKATGCYPKNIPTGTAFNKNKGEGIITATNDVAITFQVHRAEYNNPRILWEFNTLVNRYMGAWNDRSMELGNNISNNFLGVPYITQRNGRTQLVWRYDYVDPTTTKRALATPDPKTLARKPGIAASIVGR